MATIPNFAQKGNLCLSHLSPLCNFCSIDPSRRKLGLLADSRNIGYQHQWEKKLQHFRVRIEDHRLIEIKDPERQFPKIDRHKAAIIRRQMSRPVRSLLEANLLTEV
ncbi:hypothetical protein [Picosynechococcus sp. PCC 11901]|uniref:hypothetical protein n=1 Tax=Picosynechococcus sp. PCC 11901 TaxID=2579791 RepID=UPI0021022D76|nr:hypothetical protein [Picosynechococcus sp. PCC 11901]